MHGKYESVLPQVTLLGTKVVHWLRRISTTCYDACDFFYANSLNCSMICAVCYLNTMCVKMCICNVFVCYDMICVMCSISIITLLWCEDATILCVCKVLPWCDAMCVMICVLSCNNFVNTPWWCVLSYNFVNTPWVIVYSCKSHESPA